MVPIQYKALLFFIVDILYLQIGAVTLDDYCNFDTRTTPCATSCPRSLRCGRTEDNFGSLSDTQREILLAKHNQLRSDVAKGMYKDYNISACIGGINALSYSLEMEFLAECFIKQCKYHADRIILTSDGRRAVQNIYKEFSYTDNIVINRVFLERAVQEWFNKYRLVKDWKLINEYAGTESISSFTAMLWGDTEYVGCAKIHALLGKEHTYYLFCNYFPAGNLLRRPVFRSADCSNPNSKYPALCKEIRPIADDNYIKPIDLNGGSKHFHTMFCFFTIVLSEYL